MQVKPILGVDFDDVLIDFNGTLATFHNREYGTNYTWDEIHAYDLSKVWNCRYDEVYERVCAFYTSEDHARTPAVAGAIAAVQKLREAYDLIVVTSRPESFQPQTFHLVEQYYPDMFVDVIFTNHFGREEFGHKGKHCTKGEVCLEKGISVFVDDSIDHAGDVAQHGVRTFLFDTPWNRHESHPLVERVHSWDDIVIHML